MALRLKTLDIVGIAKCLLDLTKRPSKDKYKAFLWSDLSTMTDSLTGVCRRDSPMIHHHVTSISQPLFEPPHHLTSFPTSAGNLCLLPTCINLPLVILSYGKRCFSNNLEPRAVQMLRSLARTSSVNMRLALEKALEAHMRYQYSRR